MTYKAIIFDLDNTLLDYTLSERTCMQQALEQYRLHEEMTWDEFWETFGPINFAYWMNRNERKHSIREVLEHSFTDTFVQLKRDFNQSRDITETYWQLFCCSNHMEPGADQLLKELHGRHALGVISNGIGEAQRKRLAAGGLSSYFDTLVISDEVACWKPDPLIFQMALKELDAEPEEVLYVGDSLTDDYVGAKRAGIDFCLYNRLDQSLNDCKPTYIVQELLELRELL
ncbi:YjjG family noncanonical pyrimidine nucleotidase [Paenibacillus sp. JCM 10914]|uniref:HAD family hydrolase n=1 Tax=Paenibacillus sp. JCM 10914 TaxID=1236974 RepID=UPI0003CC70CF|nr:HAD family hydrolase [Paenibacillus sp. JCM 10914]GAE04720.1 5'-nucleotidase YjjG [Paenibacillus sp. JCM 10914]